MRQSGSPQAGRGAGPAQGAAGQPAAAATGGGGSRIPPPREGRRDAQPAGGGGCVAIQLGLGWGQVQVARVHGNAKGGHEVVHQALPACLSPHCTTHCSPHHEHLVCIRLFPALQAPSPPSACCCRAPAAWHARRPPEPCPTWLCTTVSGVQKWLQGLDRCREGRARQHANGACKVVRLHLHAGMSGQQAGIRLRVQ